MYLTRMELDLSRRDTMRALQAPNLFHGAIERSFPGPRARRLWRVDALKGAQYLLILSGEEPDLSEACRQFGTGGWETLPYEALLERTTVGTQWHFRLTANPTVSRKEEGDARGTVYAHITARHQEQWLLDRAAGNGFELRRGAFLPVGSRWYRFRKQKGGAVVSLLSVTYEGHLTVKDAERFRAALTGGIGRGKAYGMGLMTVARERGRN